MARLRYNGLTAELGADLLTADTTITFTAALTSAAGAVPTITGSDYIPLAVLDTDGSVLEIIHLTAYTEGATTGTVTRAQESTTAADHASGLTVINGITVADTTEFGASTTATIAPAPTGVAATDRAALQTAIDSLPATGGTIQLHPGTYLIDSPGLNLADKIGITLRGVGGLNETNIFGLGGRPATTLEYTSATGSLITATNTKGIRLEDMGLVYSSASYTGTLITLAGSTAASSSSRFHRLAGCYIGAIGTGVLDTTAPLLDLNCTVEVRADFCVFQGGRWSVRGPVAYGSDYANLIRFDTCRFERYGAQYGAIRTVGEAWSFDACVFEPGGDGSTTFALFQDRAIPGQGCTFTDCWFGDGTGKPTDGGAYISWNGSGLNVRGGEAGLHDGRSLVYVNRTAAATPYNSAGIVVSGVYLKGGNAGTGYIVDYGVSTDTKAVVIEACTPLPTTIVNGTPADAPRIHVAGLGYRTLTASTTLAASDETIVCNATSGAINVTLPSPAMVGKRVTVKKNDASANAVTVKPNSTENVDLSTAGYALTTQHQHVTVVSNGTNWWVIGS